MRKELERVSPWGFMEGPYPWFEYDYKASHKRGKYAVPVFFFVTFLVPACLAYYLAGNGDYFQITLVILAVLNIPLLIYVKIDSKKSEKNIIGSYHLTGTGNKEVYKAIVDDIAYHLKDCVEEPIIRDIKGELFHSYIWNIQGSQIHVQLKLDDNEMTVMLWNLAKNPTTGRNILDLFDKYILIKRQDVFLRVPEPENQD